MTYNKLVALLPKNFPEKSIGEILAAAAGALIVKPSQVRERGQLHNLFIHLAYRHGWRRQSFLLTYAALRRARCIKRFIKLVLRDESVMDFIEVTEGGDTRAWSRRFL